MASITIRRYGVYVNKIVDDDTIVSIWIRNNVCPETFLKNMNANPVFPEAMSRAELETAAAVRGYSFERNTPSI